MRHHKPTKPRYCDWPMHDVYQGHESAVTCPQCHNRVPSVIAAVASISLCIAQAVAYLVAFFSVFLFGGLFNE